MKHTIEGNEVIKYLQFLHEADKLEEILPVMEVPEDLVIPFITYKTSQVVGSVDTQTTVSKVAENKGMPWSNSEVLKLADMIYSNYHIESIAEELDRSPSAVRNKAYYGLNYRFVNNKWSAKGE